MSSFQNATSAPATAPSTEGEVVCWLNGQRVTIRGDSTMLSLVDWLRGSQHLTGTKVACGTGDCGSCTVLVARPHDEPPRWQPVNACLAFVHQLHGAELRTIEGVGAADHLSPLQEALVQGHGTQCGMCTPGLVLAATAALQGPPPADREQWARCLSGNVCRCTGYTAVLDAALHATEAIGHPDRSTRTASAVPTFSPDWLEARHALRRTSLALEPAPSTSPENWPTARQASRRRTLRPDTLTAALDALATTPACIVAAGTTDLALDASAAHVTWLDIGQLDELRGWQLLASEVSAPAPRDILVLGALTTWQELDTIADRECPPLAALLRRMGGPQIRASATVGGNIMTASPIGDLLPLLYVLNAELEFVGRNGTRRAGIREAVSGYRTVTRARDELLARIVLPLPHPHERLVLEKVSRRRDMDIATVSLAAHWGHDAQGRIGHVALAAGGVGPTVQRLTVAEQRLSGSAGTPDDWRDAAALALAAVAPQDDVRGSATYRRQVLSNLLTALTEYDEPSRGPRPAHGVPA